MKIFLSKSKLIKLIQKEKNLGFVPTMGAIHLGHISLIKRSISNCDKTLVTIFINKPQFNRSIDYKKYPRVLMKDISILRKQKIDYLYIPRNNQIYPNKKKEDIKINPLGKKLCGRFRPGHFEAVVDVINRFIKIIKPKKIFLGEKDMQQLKIIEDFVKKNHANIQVIGCKTVREKNGIAYSSRNSLLVDKEKKIASQIYHLLIKAKKSLIKNKLTINNLKRDIEKLGVKKIDYIKVLDINKIIRPYKKNRKYRIFVSYYLRSIRLIDNV